MKKYKTNDSKAVDVSRKQAYRLALKASLTGHDERVWSVAWSPNGNYLASTSGDKSIRVWARGNTDSSSNTESSSSSSSEADTKWVCVAKLEGVHTRTVRRVAWSPDGKQFASAGFDGIIGIWRPDETGEWDCVAQLEGHENEVKCIAWNVGGTLLASCSRDRSVWIWDCADDEFDCLSVLHGHTQDIKGVFWHPMEDVLISCSYDDSIKLWKEEGDDWYCTETITEHKSTVWDTTFREDAKYFASCSDDLSIVVHQLKDPNAPTMSMDASEDGETDDVDTDGQWQVVARQENAHTRTIYGVDWSPKDSNILASCSGDDAINFFKFDAEAQTLSQIHSELNAHANDVNAVSWHPKVPGLLASVGDDFLVKIWQLSEAQ